MMKIIRIDENVLSEKRWSNLYLKRNKRIKKMHIIAEIVEAPAPTRTKIKILTRRKPMYNNLSLRSLDVKMIIKFNGRRVSAAIANICPPTQKLKAPNEKSAVSWAALSTVLPRSILDAVPSTKANKVINRKLILLKLHIRKTCFNALMLVTA